MAGAGKRVLMVAFHFPPFGSSSGIQRSLRFVQHLPGHDWEPVVLAPHPRAYVSRRDDLLVEIPEGTPVFRAFALDAARHLSLKGRYPNWLAFPDRMGSWLLGAVPLGLRLIRKYRPAVIWTTYPVASAHLIGYVLARLSGLPWVADFRDPMLYETWPESRFDRWAAGWVERLAIRHCTRAIFVTEAARELYRSRYPDVPGERLLLIPNGYDESVFSGVEPCRPALGGRPLKIVHAGLLEPPDRNPAALFEAVAALKRDGRVSAASLRIVLRASGYDYRYRREIDDLGIGDIVSMERALPYQEAIREMVEADGLLLIQGPTCNRQIPAKLYEYMRAGTPIFAITPEEGATYRLLADSGVRTVVGFGDSVRIAVALAEFMDQLNRDAVPRISWEAVRGFDRRALTADLARFLNQVVAEASPDSPC